jgi:GH24 family phage-related lysozyme (muramidase)/N-acetylmuramoyl-L-alanine amidase CwlA
MSFKEKFTLRADYIPKPSRRRSGLLISKVRFLVAHDTGNPGSSAATNVKYFINTANTVPKAKTASAHIFVDDNEIIECVPALTANAEKAWHVLYAVPKDNELFDANANDAAIGVEYCYGGRIDADKAYEKYVWILAKLCFEFKLDASKDIVGHFFLDPKRKTDPVTGLANSRRTYDRLLQDVVKEYNDCIGVQEVTPIALVEKSGSTLTAVKLNVRTKPTTKSSIVQVLPARTPVQYKAILSEGEAVNNNAVWYVDTNGNFLWSGGLILETTNESSPVVETQTTLKPDQQCIDFIKSKEGLRLQAYQDSAGIWTIGYGTIKFDNNRPVQKGDVITLAQAEQLLAKEIIEKSSKVNAALKPIQLSKNKYNALVSFAYNVGIGALIKSTLLKRVKVNPDDDTIRDAFMMWDKAHVDGQLVVVAGLKNRRKEEADMYFS